MKSKDANLETLTGQLNHRQDLGKKMTQLAGVSKGGESEGEVVQLLELPETASEKVALSAGPRAAGGEGNTAGSEKTGSASSPLPTVKAGPLLTEPGTFHSAQQTQSGYSQPPSASAKTHTGCPRFLICCQQGPGTQVGLTTGFGPLIQKLLIIKNFKMVAVELKSSTELWYLYQSYPEAGLAPKPSPGQQVCAPGSKTP